MTFDPHKNFAYSAVATAPSPASSGTSLTVTTGEGSKFPDPATDGAFNLVVWPAGAQPTTANAEIVRCTARSGDVLTIARTQEGTSARTIVVGDQVGLNMTAKLLTDLEALISAAGGASLASAKASITAGNYTTTSTSFVDVDATNAKLTIRTGARRVLVVVTATAALAVGSGQDIFLDLDVDGTRLGQTDGLLSVAPVSGEDCNASFSFVTDVLAAGSHTFKLKWAVTGGTGKLWANTTLPLTFTVYELPDTSGAGFAGGIVQASKVALTSGDLTTSSTSFVDATGLTTTITTGGRRCLVIFQAAGNNNVANDNTAVDLAIDGTRQGGAYGLQFVSAGGAGDNGDLGFTFLTDELAPGSHTFKIQFRVDGGTGKIWASSSVSPATLTVIELTDATPGPTQVAYVNRTAGDLTITNDASWHDVPTIGDLSIPAAVGDVLEITLNGVTDNNMRFEVEFPTSGNYAGPGVSSTQGIAGWANRVSGAGPVGGSILYTVQSADIANGSVLVRLRYSTNSSGATKIFASTAVGPLAFGVKNLKH